MKIQAPIFSADTTDLIGGVSGSLVGRAVLVLGTVKVIWMGYLMIRGAQRILRTRASSNPNSKIPGKWSFQVIKKALSLDSMKRIGLFLGGIFVVIAVFTRGSDNASALAGRNVSRFGLSSRVPFQLFGSLVITEFVNTGMIRGFKQTFSHYKDWAERVFTRVY